MQAPSCTATAPQTGPWALCGATTARWASAIEATWRVRHRPPRWSGSGWRIWTTSCDSRSANWPSEVKLSPVAIGTGDRRATSTIEPICEWWTGSSSQAGPELGEAVGDAERRRGREAVVGLDHQVDVGSDRVADRPHDVDREVLVAAVLDPPGGPERVELHRRVAARDDLAGLAGDGLGRPLGPVPAVGVDADPVADLAAEQRVDRLPGRLADDVPARDLDRGDGRHVDLAAVGVDVADHPLEERLDVVRVDAEVRSWSSSIAAATVAAKPLTVPSPKPWTPSSVSTRTNSQFFQALPTMRVSTVRDSHPRSVAPWHDGGMVHRGGPRSMEVADDDDAADGGARRRRALGARRRPDLGHHRPARCVWVDILGHQVLRYRPGDARAIALPTPLGHRLRGDPSRRRPGRGDRRRVLGDRARLGGLVRHRAGRGGPAGPPLQRRQVRPGGPFPRGLDGVRQAHRARAGSTASIPDGTSTSCSTA